MSEREYEIREITPFPDLLAEYRDRGASLWGGIVLPVEYLQQGNVYGLYRPRAEKDLIGGYAIIVQPPLRTVHLLPPEVRATDPVLGNVSEEALLEITGIWIDPSIRDRRASLLLWSHLVRQALRTRKPYSIYGFDGSIEGLRKLYAPLRARTVFQGDASRRTNLRGGPSHNTLVVCLFPTGRLRWGYVATKLRGLLRWRRSGAFTSRLTVRPKDTE